jgi:hypothetical protein
MELRDALTQIADIRQQIARSQVFRGYRAATTLFTGVLAVVAGLFQFALVHDPPRQITTYLCIWILAALTAVIAVAFEMAWRLRRSASLLQRQLSFSAVEQFVPSLVAGALLTIVIVTFARDAFWMLPGLWMILFGLGIFSSARLLPRPAVLVGGFYLLAGLMLLALGADVSLSPWAMTGGFAIGQFLSAGVLYWTLERNDGSK